jgi:hypothetical protein
LSNRIINKISSFFKSWIFQNNQPDHSIIVFALAKIPQFEPLFRPDIKIDSSEKYCHFLPHALYRFSFLQIASTGRTIKARPFLLEKEVFLPVEPRIRKLVPISWP